MADILLSRREAAFVGVALAMTSTMPPYAGAADRLRIMTRALEAAQNAANRAQPEGAMPSADERRIRWMLTPRDIPLMHMTLVAGMLFALADGDWDMTPEGQRSREEVLWRLVTHLHIGGQSFPQLTECCEPDDW